MWDARPGTEPGDDHRDPSSDPRRAHGALQPGVAAGARERPDGAVSGLQGAGRDDVPEPDHGPATRPLAGAPRPDPGPLADEPDRRLLPPLDRRRELAPQLAAAAASGLITAADVVAVLDGYTPQRRRPWINQPWTGRRGRRSGR